MFDFFENFTDASALLIKLKGEIEAKENNITKDALRGRLTKRLFTELEKTPVEQVVGVGYLPSNPSCKSLYFSFPIYFLLIFWF